MSTAAPFETIAALVDQLSPLEKIRLVEHVMDRLETDLQDAQKKPKKSLLGLWKGVSISAEEIDEARKEMWGNFPRDDI